MKNQNFVNDQAEQMAQLNDLWHQKEFEEALILADDCLKVFQSDEAMGNLSDDIQRAAKLVEQTRSSLSDLKNKFSELSDILSRLAVSSEQKNAQLIDTLSGWLDNIRRIKN